MDTRLAGIYLILQELGGFRINELEDRVFAQKAIYLLQVLGVDLRYRFSWYLRGPYSKALTQCLYEIDADQDLRGKVGTMKLRPEILPVVTILKNWLAQKPAQLQKSNWFELLSSIHYIKHISLPRDQITKDSIGVHLGKRDKVFEGLQIGEAWDALDIVGLVDSKEVDKRSAPTAIE